MSAKSNNELPIGWRWTTLGKLKASSMYGPRFSSDDYCNTGVFVLRTTDISESGKVVTSRAPQLKLTDDELKRYQLQRGDLLITRTGSLGTLAVFNDDVKAIAGAYLIQYRLSAPPITSWYVFYALKSPSGQNHLVGGGAGVGRPNLNAPTIDRFALRLPSEDAQRRIVSEIEKQFTRLDAGVAALKKAQANLKRYRAAVLKAACEGKLVPTEAELAKTDGRKGKFESGEELLDLLLAERRQWFDKQQANEKTKKKYIEPAQPDAEDLPELPDGWTWGTWAQISNWVTYGFTRPMPHVERGIPIVTAKGVNNSRINFKDAHLTTREAYSELSEKDRPLPGDILITKDGTIGRAAVVDSGHEFCINQSVAVIWLRSCPMERKFLLAVIESEMTQKPIWAKARGVAIQHLSITDFAKMALPIPPLTEQKRIVAEVERRLSVIKELEAVVMANLQRASRLRQSILQKAFTETL